MSTENCVLAHATDPDRPRRALDGLWICAGCHDRLTSNLAALPGLYQRLGHALATAGAGGQRVTGSSSHQLPVNEEILEWRDQIRFDLRWWTVKIADARGLTLPSDTEPASTAAFLHKQADWAAANRAAAHGFPPVISELAGKARALLNPNGAKRIRVGPCAEVMAGPALDGEPWPVRCGGMLYATVRAEDDIRPSVIYCDGACGVRRGAEEWRKFGKDYLRERQAS